MQSIRQDIELLRRKAAECEAIARHTSHPDVRRLNQHRARLYAELVEEAERGLGRDEETAFEFGA